MSEENAVVMMPRTEKTAPWIKAKRTIRGEAAN
jgi:hypothetical protein